MIGIGVVGVGYWGPNLVRNFLSLPNCGIGRACDAKPGRLQYIKEHFPEVEVTSDYTDLLQDPRLDAICVATPVSTHRNLALRALDSGRHVFVESSTRSLLSIDLESGRGSAPFDLAVPGNDWDPLSLGGMHASEESVVVRYQDRIVRYDASGHVLGADVVSDAMRDYRWLLPGDGRG